MDPSLNYVDIVDMSMVYRLRTYDGRRIVSGSLDGTIRGWDVETGDLYSWNSLTQTGDGYFTSVAFSPNGTQIASCTHTGKVTIWDAHRDSRICEGVERTNQMGLRCCIPHPMAST